MDKKFLIPNGAKVFFIGIGGVSMSALAEFLSGKGYEVSGSDKNRSLITKKLEQKGIKIFYAHSPKNLCGANVVVYSSAIADDNQELIYAREQNIPIVKRSLLLNEILKEYKRSVAISGCHGKTTTTAMLGEIMLKARQNPTVFLGGEYGDYGNLLEGGGDLVIAEACEYKKSFLDIQSKIAVVLNLDNDHLDSYDGMKDVVSSFKAFVGDRLAVINADDKYVTSISNCTTVTFGIDQIATYYAQDIKEKEKGVSFTACAYAKPYGRINLKVSGKHNVYNALAAFATADMLGASFSAVKRGLESFKGVKRRNEYLGSAGGKEYYADYAHHPTEIKATLSSFSASGQDFVIVFQPHTYSRTKILMNDFIEAFDNYNNVIIYRSYPAREKFDKKGSAKTLKDKLSEKVEMCAYAHTQKQLKAEIDKMSKDKKRILFLGAGDIYHVAERILTEKQKVQKKS